MKAVLGEKSLYSGKYLWNKWGSGSGLAEVRRTDGDTCDGISYVDSSVQKVVANYK